MNIIELAREAGMDWQGGFTRVVEYVTQSELERFAALVRAAALEEAEADEQRLVWAMHNMSNPFGRHEFGFSQHVLERGSTGDIDDCRTYIDAHLESLKEKT